MEPVMHNLKNNFLIVAALIIFPAFLLSCGSGGMTGSGTGAETADDGGASIDQPDPADDAPEPQAAPAGGEGGGGITGGGDVSGDTYTDTGAGTDTGSKSTVDDQYYNWYENKRQKVVNKGQEMAYGFAYNYYPTTYYDGSGYSSGSYKGISIPLGPADYPKLPKLPPYINIPDLRNTGDGASGAGDTTTTKYPLTATGGALYLDTAVDANRQRVLVVFERASGGGGDEAEIWGRFYGANGEKIGEDVLISEGLNANPHIDPKFHAVPAFANLTEPICTSFQNPTVVFIDHGMGTASAGDRYLIAYEAHCEGKVRWPNNNQFFNNPQPENPVFDLADTAEKVQKFTVIKAIKVRAEDLGKLQANEAPGPFTSHRMMGRLFAWFLYNNQGANGAPVLKDASIWKWSSAANPHLSVNSRGTVLLTYQTNLKFTTCLSNRVDPADPEGVAQRNRYDGLATIEGQLVYPDKRSPAFSVFRSAATAPDGSESNPEPDMCVNFEDKRDLESVYHPSSAANTAGSFVTIFSLERGAIGQYYAQSTALPKVIGGNPASLNAAQERIPPVAGADTGLKISYLVDDPDLAGSPVTAGESEHSATDIAFDVRSGGFVSAFDDGKGIHVFFVGDDMAVIDPSDPNRLKKGVNWADTVAERAYRPRFSDGISVKQGERDISKFGLSYHYKSSADKWLAGQNYVRLGADSNDVLEAALEKSPANHYNLSGMIAGPVLEHSFGPSAVSFDWMGSDNRFRTFWTASPPHDGGDTIYSVFVPEGMNPVAFFDILWGESLLKSEDGTATIRLNNISNEQPLRFNLKGSRSEDPDAGPGAVANGIVSWQWVMEEGIDGLQFGPVELNGELANAVLTQFGRYRITLTVKDSDGLTATTFFTLMVERNMPPAVTTLDMAVLDGDEEVPLVGDEPVAIRGQDIVLTATGMDTDHATPPEGLRFRWEVMDPAGGRIRDIVEIEGSRKVRFNAGSVGRYTVSVWAVDSEGAESAVPVSRRLRTEALAIQNFASLSGQVINLSPASVAGNPAPDAVYGEVVLSWSTTQAENIRLLKQEWDSDARIGGNPQIEVPRADLTGLQGEGLPPSTDGVGVRLRRKTSLVLEVNGGGLQVRSEPVVVSFGAPLVQLSAPQSINYNDATRDGEAILTWNTRNIKEVHLLAYAWRDYQTPPDYANDRPRSLDPAGGYLRLIQQENYRDRIAIKTTYKLRGADLFGGTIEDEKTVSLSGPRVVEWSIRENEVYMGGAIHLSWRTSAATRLDVKYIRNAREQTIHSVVNQDEVLSSADVEIDMPGFVEIGESQIRIDLLGPGGVVQSQARNLNVVAGVRIDSFISNVPQGDFINLMPASVAGNPAPDAVYGEVYLTWQTSRAQFVQLFKKEWAGPNEEGNAERILVPAADMPDWGASQDVLPLPLNPDVPGIRLRVRRNTTYTLVARSVEGGEEYRLERSLSIRFNPSSASLNVAAAGIPFDNALRTGAAGLTWGTVNIREVHLVAYEWADFGSEPNYNGPAPRSLNPAEGYLHLNQQAFVPDNIARKTTYILRATDLYGREIPVAAAVQKIVEFQLPEVLNFAANPPVVDFADGGDSGQSTLGWGTRNSVSVRLFAAGNEVVGSPFQTDAGGNGSSVVSLQAPTTYFIRAANPDGRTVESNRVDVGFNAPAIEIAVPMSVEDAGGLLYFGREASVAWGNSRNVRSMVLYLADENGNVVQGNPTQRIEGIAAVLGGGPWTFRLPDVQNPPLAGRNYKIRAELANPNGGAPVVVKSALFAINRRPSPRITNFRVSPSSIEDLFEDGGQIKGRSRLEWAVAGADADRPIVSIRERKNNGAWQAMGANFDALTADGSLEVVVGVGDLTTEYELTVRNRFDDRVSTGGRPLYADEAAPPANAVLRFAPPRVVSWSVAEGEAYPERNIHINWETKAVTLLEVVLIRGGDEDVIYTENSLAGVISSANRAVMIPGYDAEEIAQIRLDITGPAGVTSSQPVQINLRLIPQSGVISFCAEPSFPAGSDCRAGYTLDLPDGQFANATTMRWVLNARQVERVVRLCVGNAPDQDGACPGRSIDLPAGANFIDQGDGTGIGSAVVNVSEANQYWMVTKPQGREINIGYDTPVTIGFNGPVFADFTAARDLINQGMTTGISWSGVRNATRVSIEVQAGEQVQYQSGGNFVAFPFSADSDAAFMPNGSLTITTPVASGVRFILRATGPGGEVVSNAIEIAVNDIPSVPAAITEPAGDLDTYAPTHLYVEWSASENNLNDDQGAAIDADGISRYAVCYDVYRTNAAGGVLDPGGNKENDRVQGAGAPCPDVANTAFASLDDLPDEMILVQPLASAGCGEGSRCIVDRGRKYYRAILYMDPRLNDPAGSAYIRYEIKVLTIDGGRNGRLLGIRVADEAARIVTDDSVEAWWRFTENFTGGAPDCAGAPGGYKICDSGRHAHHAIAMGGPGWLNGAIVLNSANQRSQWALVNERMSNIDEFALEVDTVPYLVDPATNYYLFTMGDRSDDSAERDWINAIVVNRFRLRVTSTTGTIYFAGNIIDANTNYHVVYQCERGGNATISVDGNAENTVPCQDLSFADDKRFSRIGASHLSVNNPNGYPPYSGEIRDLIFYKRPLFDYEVNNHYEHFNMR